MRVPKVVSTIAYGAAGSGVGSRIGSHLKWGGGWIRRFLLLIDMLVMVTDKY
ncbi:hypothetical protein BGX28_000325, partial [Mortierella sp. GBA30]